MILIERKRVRAPFTLPPAIKRAITVEIATPPDERFISPPPSPSHKRCRLTSSPSSGSPPPLNVLPPRKRIMRVRLVRHDRLIEETHDQLQDISVAKIESTKQDIEALRPRAEVVEETRGAVGWTCWFEKMEIVFRINNCADNCRVKYASCTLLDGALTWWNSYMQAVGIDAAYETSWKELMKIMTEDVGYTKQFQELALLFPIMVSLEEKKIERYIWVLTYEIQGNVTSSKPTKIQEAICMEHNLMDQNVVKAYNAGSTERVEYAGRAPLCNRCTLHHTRLCTVKCNNCKRVGHIARNYRSLIDTTNQGALTTTQKTSVTCFRCGAQGYYKRECPKLRNKNGNIQNNGGGARGRELVLGGGQAI
ncbi:reverse transcriptase domain-containing protein [Tanacetum coccineum]